MQRILFLKVMVIWGVIILLGVIAASQMGLPGTQGVPGGWKRVSAPSISHRLALGQPLPRVATHYLFMPPIFEPSATESKGKVDIVFLSGHTPPQTGEEIRARELKTYSMAAEALTQSTYVFVEKDLLAVLLQEGVYMLALGDADSARLEASVWRSNTRPEDVPTAQVLTLSPGGVISSNGIDGSIMLRPGFRHASPSLLLNFTSLPYWQYVLAGLLFAAGLIALWIARQPALPTPSKFATSKVALPVACLAIVLALAGYFWNAKSAPSGFFMDSVATSVSAACLAETGMDEYGASYPLVGFRSLGEYKAPIYTYILAGIAKIGRPDLALSRTLSTSFGLLGILLCMILGRKLTDRDMFLWMAPWFFAFFLLSPWVLVPHKLAHEISLAVLMTSLLLLVTRAFLQAPGHVMAGVILGIVTGLMPYVCHVTKTLYLIQFPLVIMVLGLSKGSKVFRWHHARGLYTAMAVCLIVSLPVILDVLGPAHSLARLRDVPAVSIGQAMENFFRHANPSYLFFRGDMNPRHHTGYRGMLNVVFLPFLVFGIGYALKRSFNEKNPFLIYILLYLVASLIPVSLTSREYTVATRSMITLPALIITCFIGGQFVWELGRRFIRTRLVALLAALALMVGCFEAYTNLWHYHQVTLKAQQFSYSYFGPQSSWDSPTPLCRFDDRSFMTLNYRYYRIVEKGDYRFCQFGEDGK